MSSAEPALLSLAAESMFSWGVGLKPAPDPYLLQNGWTIHGYLSAEDRLFWLGQRVFYGFLAEKGGEWVCVIRGTMDMVEWAEDADAATVPHPKEGRVHQGFYTLYQTFEYESVTQASSIVAPLPEALRLASGDSPIAFYGHSLGAALATYAAVDYAPKAMLRAVASPRPGDAGFAAYAGSQVPDHQVDAYARDLVPQVPAGLGYTHLPNLSVLPANERIPDNPVDDHHAATYGWLRDPTAVTPAYLKAA